MYTGTSQQLGAAAAAVLSSPHGPSRTRSGSWRQRPGDSEAEPCCPRALPRPEAVDTRTTWPCVAPRPWRRRPWPRGRTACLTSWCLAQTGLLTGIVKFSHSAKIRAPDSAVQQARASQHYRNKGNSVADTLCSKIHNHVSSSDNYFPLRLFFLKHLLLKPHEELPVHGNMQDNETI